jgi:hypothetical protein
MEENKNNKKQIIPVIIGVVVLVLLVVGASFSYYLVTGSNTTTTTAGRVTLEKAGTVALTQGVSNIYLDVTAAQMAQSNAGTNYYGMSTETTAATTPQNHVLATIQATGGANNTIYECMMGYSLEVSQIENSSNSAYAALEREDAEIIISTVPASNSGNVANWIGDSYPLKGTDYLNQTGISRVLIHGNTSLQITGDLILHNLNKGQNDLAELGVNVSFQVTSFSCNPVDPVTIALTADNGTTGLDEGDVITIANNSGLNEQFWVVSSDSTNTVLLAKYNLLVGSVYDLDKNGWKFTLTDTLNSSDTGYGLQNEDARGYTGESGEIVGIVPFSGTNYWDNSVCEYSEMTWGCTGTNGLASGYTGTYEQYPYSNVYNSSLSNVSPQIVYGTPGTNTGAGRAQNNGYTIAYYVENYLNILKGYGLSANSTGRLLIYEEFLNIANGNTTYTISNASACASYIETQGLTSSQASTLCADGILSPDNIGMQWILNYLYYNGATINDFEANGITNVNINYSELYNYISNNYSTSWLGSSYNEYNLLTKSYNSFSDRRFGIVSLEGVRPVIVVPTSSIQTS